MMDYKLPDFIIDAPIWWRMIEIAIFLGISFLLGYVLGRGGRSKITENIPVGTSSVSSDSILTDSSSVRVPDKEQSSPQPEPILQVKKSEVSDIESQKSTEPDDLTVIDGIGPKLASILNQNDITNFRQLAQTSSLTLRKILDEEGPQFKVHDPTYWPRQAALAKDGSWDDLSNLQTGLNK